MIGLAADSGRWRARGRDTGERTLRLSTHTPRPKFPHALLSFPLSLSPTGCGKSTFMRRMTSVFGGTPKPPAGE